MAYRLVFARERPLLAGAASVYADRMLSGKLNKFLKVAVRWAGVVVNLCGVKGLQGLPRYLRDWHVYAKAAGRPIRIVDSYPCLGDATHGTSFDPHYFYQGAWLARRLVQLRPPRHVDISSSVQTVSVISAFVETTFIDYRVLRVSLPGLECVQGDLLALDLPSESVPSLSCMHVIEHVGLGRYGDPIDPHGSEKAAMELGRVLARSGPFFLTVPVGRERVCFNAHRIFFPQTVLEMFKCLELRSFAYVDDERQFHDAASPADAENCDYGCGMFCFVKP